VIRGDPSDPAAAKIVWLLLGTLVKDGLQELDLRVQSGEFLITGTDGGGARIELPSPPRSLIPLIVGTIETRTGWNRGQQGTLSASISGEPHHFRVEAKVRDVDAAHYILTPKSEE
jgi:hypothetical protein